MEPKNGSSNGGSRAPSPSDFRPGSSSGKASEMISVVIPAYRCSQYIAQAVQSVLVQPFPACELIIVNAGSPDTPLLVEDCAIGMSTVVSSREPIIRAGSFDQELLRCEDFEMWLRMALAGARMAYHTDVQVFHRINEAGLSADKLSMKKDRIRVYQKMASNFSISERQQGIVGELIARTEADCQVDELKRALEKGDYVGAFAAARQASAAKSNWKLKISLWGLRLMP